MNVFGLFLVRIFTIHDKIHLDLFKTFDGKRHEIKILTCISSFLGLRFKADLHEGFYMPLIFTAFETYDESFCFINFIF